MAPTRTTPRRATAARPLRPRRPASTSSCGPIWQVLKLADAAEHLPAVLDVAAAENLTVTAALERLLAIEVNATEARRLAGRLRFACLPTPATLEDFDYDAASGVDPLSLIHI